MLTESEILEVREHLEKSQNPLFFFDNDVDGLSSFLILARYYDRGKGVAIKSGELNDSYLRKINELNPDAVFVLDKPLVSRGFIEGVRERNIPLIWIDHHNIEVYHENVYYYNPAVSRRQTEPTTYLAYQIARKKEDLWLALTGCIADNYFPNFAEEFAESYKELWKPGVRTGFQVLYETGIGRIARILDFSLKDKTSSVIKMIRFLLKVTSPNEISSENSVFARFDQIDKKYQALIEKARKFAKSRILYFQYAGDLSISSGIANELSYKFPGRLIVVVYISGSRANISIRGKNAKGVTEKAIAGFNNAMGGGHEEATGAKIDVSDLPEFKKRVGEFS